MHSKNYSKTFNDSRNIAIAFWKSNSRLYKNGYYKNGKRQLRNFKCASRIARKIVKKILKKHQKEKNREVKTIHIQSDITKNSIIYFFLNYLFRNIQKWNDWKFLKFLLGTFRSKLERSNVYTQSRILDTVLRRFERKAFVREMQSRSEPCATTGVVWIVHFICLPFSRAPRANSTPFGSDRSIVRNPTTGVADTSI